MEPYRQQYIPVSRARVKESLFNMFNEDERENLAIISTMLEALWHHSSHAGLEELKKLYEDMDPDQIGMPNVKNRDNFIEIFVEMLEDGNWEKITESEIDEALEGEDVFPISLDVRFDELETMLLYKLGQVTIHDKRKSWFGQKITNVEIEAYDRIVQIIEFKNEQWFKENKTMKYFQGESANGIHIRLFRTIPKLDIETIFPNTSPSMKTLDKVKIIAPLIGGLATIISKYGPILLGGDSGDTNSSVLIGLCTALGTYMLKTYLSYQKTREDYQTQVSKDLYFKGLANNSAAINMIVDLSEEQEVKEALLAYSFLLKESGHNQESLDERIETWLMDTYSHDIDFEVDDALRKLEDLNLLITDSENRLSVKNMTDTLTALDERWDNLYDY
tara:strand:+ start:572 stop:1741 length:1170 start_codon:yes stop_codon:yes gene_type:complete